MNALDAIVQVWNNVSMMRQQLLPTDRIHGIVTDGGQAVKYIDQIIYIFTYIPSSLISFLNIHRPSSLFVR